MAQHDRAAPFGPIFSPKHAVQKSLLCNPLSKAKTTIPTENMHKLPIYLPVYFRGTKRAATFISSALAPKRIADNRAHGRNDLDSTMHRERLRVTHPSISRMIRSDGKFRVYLVSHNASSVGPRAEHERLDGGFHQWNAAELLFKGATRVFSRHVCRSVPMHRDRQPYQRG